MLPAIATIALYTVREAARNRLGWVLLALILAALGLAGFLGELALTESGQLQVALLAAALRLCGAALLATFIITSLVREANERGQQLLLALALPRAAYVLGKLAGFCLLAAIPALAFGALALLFAPAAACAIWATSLLLEFWIVAAFSLLCALSLNQVVPALSASAGFYVLARAIGGLQHIGASAAGVRSAPQQFMQTVIDLLAALLPRLDAFARSEWLVYPAASADLGQLAPLLLQCALYMVLLGAAALFDFYRREL